MSETVKHPRSGKPILREVYADPGVHGWYYREKMPDSVAKYILEADHKAEVERLRAALSEIARQFSGIKGGHMAEMIATKALEGDE